MPICVLDNFWGELNIAAPMFYWPPPATIFKKSNFNHGACLKDIPMKSGMLVAQIQWKQNAKFQGKYQILTSLLATWSVRQLLVSTLSPSLSGHGWNQVLLHRESLTEWKHIRNASKVSKSVWKYVLSLPLIITTQLCQWCIGVHQGDTPPLEIPLISLWRWATQSFISHFNQYSLVDPSWGNIPSWVWQGG